MLVSSWILRTPLIGFLGFQGAPNKDNQSFYPALTVLPKEWSWSLGFGDVGHDAQR